jgi:hypothetical protein
MDVTLPEELLVFAYDDDTGRPLRVSSNIGYGLAGAALVELELAGRISVLDGKLELLDRSPVGDPVLDAVLERVVSVERLHKADWWVQRLQSRLRDKVLARLVERGVLRLERRPVLRVFSVRRYPVVDRGIESNARSQLERVVVHNGEADARTAALATLLYACGLARPVFPELSRKQLKMRMGQLDEGHWAGDAVRKAISASQSSSGG